VEHGELARLESERDPIRGLEFQRVGVSRVLSRAEQAVNVLGTIGSKASTSVEASMVVMSGATASVEVEEAQPRGLKAVIHDQGDPLHERVADGGVVLALASEARSVERDGARLLEADASKIHL